MTRFALASAPASEPVTLNEAKDHLRISHAFEDTLITGFIVAARKRVEADTLRSLITQTWTATLDRWPPTGCSEESEVWPFTTSPTTRRIPLAHGPVASITSLVVDGETIDADEYALRGDEIWISESVADSTAELGGGIVITYVTGAATIATDLKLAVLMMTGTFYTVRETTSPQGIYHQVAPFGYDTLISPYKVLEI